MNPFCVTLPALILLLALSAPVKGDIPCTTDSSKCVCSGNNFTLSIGDAFPDGYVNITDSSGGGSFVLSPCKDFSCGGKPSRVCQWDASGEAFNVVGTAKEVDWSVESSSKFTVNFKNGEKIFNGHLRAGALTCIADASVTEPKYSYDGEGDPNTDNPLVYSFTVTAKSFTSAPSGGGGGGNVAGIAGIVIILLLLMAVALYFIIGAVVMYTVKGARGTEIIPNGAFWKDLPFLIKDGFMFTFAPCVNKIREKRGYSSL